MWPGNDPTYSSLLPHLNQSSAVAAGVAWAGNGAVADTFDALFRTDRARNPKTPLAMYRGSKDGTMTAWAQSEVQSNFNASGIQCDLYGVPGHGHGDLMPNGLVGTHNGMALPGGPKLPVLEHSFGWLVDTLGLHLTEQEKSAIDTTEAAVDLTDPPKIPAYVGKWHGLLNALPNNQLADVPLLGNGMKNIV